jgi:chaperonin cofactor prefoldin
MSIRLVPLFLLTASLPAAELPIRQVVLYKHGVGFFERAGSIPAGETARLDFKVSEMNDVLKSLIINGKAERVTGLRYDSSVPLAQTLSQFPFQIDAGVALSGVLDQLKGARVELQIGNEKTAGEIVAARVVAGDKDRTERQQIVLLVDSGEMRTLDLDAATSIGFTDAKLQAQFREYLLALTAARSKDKRSVYIDGNVTGARDITAEYIIPTPIWKSSYRLLFGEGEPVLEGWAIVDNTTDDDWVNVQMALVSGKPISFISELYSPRYIQRLRAELPEEQAVAPALHQGGVAGGVAGGVLGAIPAESNGLIHGLGDRAATEFERVQSFGALQKAPPVPHAAPSSIAPTGAAFEIADLFQYRIAQPVTIKKNQSAMLPFLQSKIKARKVVLYSDQTSPHPLNAAELANSTGETLDGGPVTVFDAGAYAGEALVETVKAGDKRLITYGVDLGTRITTTLESGDREQREFHLNRGVMTVKVATNRTTTFTIHNVDAKAKTLIIEDPIEQGFSVISNQKPIETTSSVRRFEVILGANADVKFPLVEERIDAEEQVISSLTPDVLLVYTRNKHLSDAGKRALAQIMDLKKKIAANSAQMELASSQIRTTTSDEERVRKNLESLNRVSGQQEVVQKYAAQLAQLETKIANLNDQQSDTSNKNAALSAELNDLLEELSF